MSLFGNNTYTGSTVLNGGATVATGTNASTSVKIMGAQSGLSPTALTLQGANGSFLSTTLFQASASGALVLDNNATLAANGLNQPTIPGAQNNNRIRDDAEVQLRDGVFILRGLSTSATSETYGKLNAVDGHNSISLTPNGAGGTATLIASGDLTLGSRATLQIGSTVLGTTAKAFFNGSIPAADSTGILPRIVGSADFLTYNATTGMTPLTSYSSTLAAGTNVALTAASSTNSVTVNAIKRTGTFVTTINAGETLGVTSGMIFNSSGTATIAGGTLAFGNTPGVLFGSMTVSSAITGTQGVIVAAGTTMLSGDLSGLSGLLSSSSFATLTLGTDTFTGPIQLRNGTLAMTKTQLGNGLGALTVGVPETDSNVYGSVPILTVAGAGANAAFDRPIIIDNGGKTIGGSETSYALVPIIQPLNNTTGSQTFNGAITLNSSVALQGGAAAAVSTGATNFTGPISGDGTFYVVNGRVNFSGNLSNAGGFALGSLNARMAATFSGSVTGTAPITLSGGTANTLSYQPGSLPTGPITIINAIAAQAPTIIPLASSSINNVINVNTDLIVSVGSGITANFNGPVNGVGPLTKSGVGTLVLGNAANTHTGALTVTAGTMKVNGLLPSASVTVASTATLGGVGTFSGNLTVAAGGILAPGNSIGTLGTGSIVLAGELNTEIDAGLLLADLLNVSGSVSLSNANLAIAVSNAAGVNTSGTYLLIANDGADAVTGTFTTISGLPAGWSATIDYAFAGTDALGRVGTGNDVAVTVFAVPEPTILSMFGMVGMLGLARRRNAEPS